MIQPPSPRRSGSGRAGRPVTPARIPRGWAAPGSRPSAADGEHRLRRGGAAGCPGPAFPGPPGWRRRGLVRGSRAEADGRVARAPVLVGLVLAYPLNRPRHPYLAVRRNKPVQHGSRPWIGRQLSPLVAVAVREEDQPSLQAAQDHQAGRGNGVAGCARDGHGFRHRLTGRVQPRGELTQRVSIQVYDIHPPSLAPPRPVSDIDLGRYAATQRSAALSTDTFGHVRDGIGTVRPPDSRSAARPRNINSRRTTTGCAEAFRHVHSSTEEPLSA
jgi:hypothetical protein